MGFLMPIARIYQPSKTSMQSGKAKTKLWILDYNPAYCQFKDPLMGWAGTNDTQSQVQLHFKTSQEAIAFAKRQGLDFTLKPAIPAARVQRRSYSDNFLVKR